MAGPGRLTNRHPPPILPISVPHDSAPHRTWGQPLPCPTSRVGPMLEKPHLSVDLTCGGVHRPSVCQLRGRTRASVGRKRYPGAAWEQPRRVTLPVGPDGMAIFAGALRVLRRRRVGNLKFTQGGEIWAVRSEEGSEGEGAGRRILAAATAAYGYLTPHCRRRTRPWPLSTTPSPISRSPPVASQFGSSHTS
jgi:hypothetical protein